MVSQKTLPEWLHPDAYVDACRAGRIEGARLWRRQWIATRHAVVCWVMAESVAPPPQSPSGHPVDQDLEAVLRENSLAVNDQGAPNVPPRRRDGTED